MKVTLIKQPDFDPALYGLGLNKGITSDIKYPDFCKEEYPELQMYHVANNLSKLTSEHKKFLRQIEIVVLIDMPRYWWSEFDTYKIGTTAQSESTMHTILKQDLSMRNFEVMFDISQAVVSNFINWVNIIKKEDISDAEKICKIKSFLPESFRQKRLVTMNYEVFSNIYKQRHNHRLPEWKYFCETLFDELPNNHWIIGE